MLSTQIALETEFDNTPALGLYTSLGFVPEKRLHRFYLNGKDAFRLVLPLSGAEDAAGAAAAIAVPGDKQQELASALLQQLPSPHGASDDDDDDDEDDVDADVSAALRAGSSSSKSRAEDEGDYAENTTKLVRLRRRVAALRACRMITVWPAEDDEDRVSGR